MTKHLRGRVALVTGGASGIGRACALALAGDGADLAIGSLLAKAGRTRPEVENSYYPTDEELSRTEAEIGEHGVRVFAAPLDVRDGIAVDTFIADASDALGPADIVVTAAGIDASQPVAEHDDGLWTQVIDTNLNGNFRVIKRCLPGMIERGRGRIVIIGSTSATIGAAGQAAYAAAKAGLLGLMRCVGAGGRAPRRLVQHGESRHGRDRNDAYRVLAQDRAGRRCLLGRAMGEGAEGLSGGVVS